MDEARLLAVRTREGGEQAVHVADRPRTALDREAEGLVEDHHVGVLVEDQRPDERRVVLLAGGDKFIDLPVPELYDFKTDPGELRNQAAQDTARATVMRNTLATFDTALPGAPGRESAAVSEQLRALVGGLPCSRSLRALRTS